MANRNFTLRPGASASCALRSAAGWFVLMVCVGMATSLPAGAATRSWLGGTSTNWNTTTNWTGSDVPDGNDTAGFNSNFTGSNQPTVTVNDSLQAIIFAAGLAKNVTISVTGGAVLTLGGTGGVGIDNQQSTYAVVINTNLALGANQIWQGNTMDIGGAVQLGARTLTLSPDSGATITIGGVISGTGAFTQSGAGTTVLSGANTYSGATTISQGTLNIQSNTALGSTAGATTVSSGAQLQIQGGITSAENITLSGTGVSGTGAIRNISGSNTLSGNITQAAAATVQSDSGLLTISGPVSGNFALTVAGSGDTTISGVISGNASSTLTKNGSGTLTLSGANTYSGVTTLNNGTLSVSNLANGGSSSNIGNSSNAASNLVFNGGTLQYTGSGSSSNRLFTLGASGGTIEANGTGALNFTNTGSLTISGAGARTLTLNGTSTATNNLSADISGNTSVVKDGTGTWQLSGDNTMNGTVTVKNGLLLLNSDTINGGVPPSAELVVGDGVGAANSAIARNLQEGQVGNTSTVTVYSDGWFDINAAAYPDKGGVGAYREETVGQINLYGGRITTGNPGSLNIDASLPGAGISSFANSQTAVIDATGGLVDFKGLTRTISVEDGSQVTDLNIVGQITNGGVTKTGAGRLSFTGTEANTYTGATVVNGGTLELAKSSGVTSIAGSSITVNSGGTLLLGSSNQINNSANLTLNNAILSTGETVGYSETLGTLTLSGNSSIDLGTASHLLQFANSSALSGSWSGTLTINGWTGIPETSGTSGQIFFGNNATGLTAGQLAMISFTGFGPGAMLLTTGELVPVAVPEPEAVLAALLIVGALAWRERNTLRRFLGPRTGATAA